MLGIVQVFCCNCRCASVGMSAICRMYACMYVVYGLLDKAITSASVGVSAIRIIYESLTRVHFSFLA